MRAITVAINGVYQQIGRDFVDRGHMVVFKSAPTGIVEVAAHTRNDRNTSVYTGNGTQIGFNLPAFPRANFEVIPHTSKDWIPKGYSLIDVNTEIDLWLRDNCACGDWKWTDQLAEDIGFGMTRLIVRDSIVTYIATRWAE